MDTTLAELPQTKPDELWNAKMMTPPSDPATTIWRYMSADVFVKVIANRCLMFNQFHRLQESDRREGMVIEGFWESVKETPDADIGVLQEKGEHNLKLSLSFAYANCWNKREHESALMWKAYAPQGIAIQTTVGKLMDAKIISLMNKKVTDDEDPPKLEQFTIEYADHWSELEAKGYRHHRIPLNRLFLHTKRNAFSDENEVRFHVQPIPKFPVKPNGSPSSADPLDCPPWCPVVFDTLDWIEQIVAAPSAPDSTTNPVRQLAKQNGIKFRISGI